VCVCVCVCVRVCVYPYATVLVTLHVSLSLRVVCGCAGVFVVRLCSYTYVRACVRACVRANSSTISKKDPRSWVLFAGWVLFADKQDRRIRDELHTRMCITTATHNCEALDPTTHTHTRTKTHTYTQRQGILARRGADAFQAAIARHALGAPLRRQRPCPRLRTVRRVRTRGVPCSDRTRGAGLCPTRQLSLCILHIALRARTHIVIYGSAHAIAWVLCCARHMQKLPACVPPPLPVCMPRTAARGDAKGASHRGRLRVPAGFAHGGAASLLAGPCPSSRLQNGSCVEFVRHGRRR